VELSLQPSAGNEENRAAGIPVSPEDLCAETPELLQELKWTIRALEAVESRFGVISTQQEQPSTAEGSSLEVERSDTVLVSSEYRIEELHASGGPGSVYVAIDPVLNRKVAIKFPRWKNLTSEQAGRFEREARVTGRLDHPGIVPVHALKSDRTNHPCCVMRFVDGKTLQARIQFLHSAAPKAKTASFFESHEFRQLLRNLVTVCNIVAYAHEQGVIHRDIKPANIILEPFGEVLLLDRGWQRSSAKPRTILQRSQQRPRKTLNLKHMTDRFLGRWRLPAPNNCSGTQTT
jgi:hypothetical protein